MLLKSSNTCAALVDSINGSDVDADVVIVDDVIEVDVIVVEEFVDDVMLTGVELLVDMTAAWKLTVRAPAAAMDFVTSGSVTPCRNRLFWNWIRVTRSATPDVNMI